jgi:Derlin-2/3
LSVSVLRSQATADDSKAIAGVLLDGYIFLPALSLAYAYTYAQDNPTRQVNFFIVNFDAKYLPWAMLFMTFVIDGPDQAKTQFAGLIAAHLYDFLTRIWPTFGGGRNYIFTPQVVKRWFGGSAGVPQNRGYGYAVPSRGRDTGDDAASGRSTGNSWGGVGPGRRLG